MRPAAFLEHVTRQIHLVHPLHDHHVGPGPGIVEAGRQGLVPPGQCCCSDGRAFDLTHVVRIVDDNDVAALAGQRPADGGREPHTACVVLEADLGVLIRCQTKAAAPGPSIRGTLNEPAALDAVADTERPGIGREQEPRARALQRAAYALGVLSPDPGRPGDRDRDRLHVSRRHGDQQLADLTPRHGLQLLADDIDMPTGDEWSGIDMMPKQADEIRKALPGQLPPNSAHRRHAQGSPRVASVRRGTVWKDPVGLRRSRLRRRNLGPPGA